MVTGSWRRRRISIPRVIISFPLDLKEKIGQGNGLSGACKTCNEPSSCKVFRYGGKTKDSGIDLFFGDKGYYKGNYYWRKTNHPPMVWQNKNKPTVL